MEISFERHDSERLRRSIVLLAPRHPGGLDREAAMAVVEELQRMQDRDRRVGELLDQVIALLRADRDRRTTGAAQTDAISSG